MGDSYAIVRIRGPVNVNGGIQDTMKMLRLGRPNHCVIVPKDPNFIGMLKKVKDYVAYGEVDAGTAAELFKTRGRLIGDKPVDDAFVNEATEGKYTSVEAFAQALAKGETKVKELGEAYKPLFRLSPPRGGHKGSIKRHATVGGVLGYQGKDINTLLRRMM